jgi:23S rRNA U2552 (ribose-2'-O)-methylase RlmE/FtsJ
MIKILDDKYYLKYKKLFNYNYYKFNIINQNILYNYILFSNDKKNKICNSEFKYSTYIQSYSNIVLRKDYNNKLLSQLNQTNLTSLNFHNFIINNNYYKNKSYLIITKLTSLVQNIYFYNNKDNIDIILFYDSNIPLTYVKEYIINLNILKQKYKIINILNILLEYNLYINYLNNLKNDKIIKKYDTISCHIGYILGLGLTASYKMMLEIPNIISTIAMALKNIAKDGILLLFWTIVNINVPVIKKILELLVYGFKNVEIIDNDINQNLLIGVPEYYIKCSGYKDNISDELINKLLDIAIETVEYTYGICDVLDYYEDYTEKNPNHSLFYNKIEKEDKTKDETIKSSLTKKVSRQSSSQTLTRKSSSHSTNTKSNIKPIYYIEDINIPELDKIMKDSHLQFEVGQLMNKLEGIFVGYFKMVNNLILNAITKDKDGNLIVKKEAIIQKDITNLTKLITMFEYNKLPYNKHALNVVLNKQDEILDHFYSLDTPVNQKLIKYEDRTSKMLVKHALEYFNDYNTDSKLQSKSQSKLQSKSSEIDMINEYYNRIKIALQVKYKLLEDISDENTEHKIPYRIDSIVHDFAGGLCDYLNNKYKTLPIEISDSFVKLWEILSQFNLIPEKTQSLKVLHLCEAPGQMILCVKYWIESKCPNLSMDNYEWMANTLNPYEAQNRYRFNKDVSKDMYGLIKHNYDKWLWGYDNTGDITKPNVIKSIKDDIKKKWTNKEKLDLVISDGSISFTNNDKLTIQKLDFAQVIAVLACSSIGSDCCIKHFIPYVNLEDPNLNKNNNNDKNYSKILNESITEDGDLFISYLYLYYISFDSISLYKPNSSKSNTSEFYVVAKGFKGIEEDYLDSLLKIIDHFQLNNTLIDKNKIPKTFLSQIKNFLESMSNTNILTIEKENLLLTCYKNNEDNNKKVNKILKCDNFFEKKKIDSITLPKYKEWIKIFNFQ